MRYDRLGTSDITVSRICLGAMGFGVPNEQYPWTIGYEEAEAVVRAALDAGITFFDTAYGYNMGTSEEFLGKALRTCAARDEVVVSTKFPPPGADERKQGYTDAGWVRHCCDTSLQRLGMDYIDLYICHWWGTDADMEAVFAELNTLVDEGKVRALGASSFLSWQLALYNSRAEYEGLARIQSLQMNYNLIFREEEREGISYCREHDVAITPFYPLAAGRLARPPHEPGESARAASDHIAARKYGPTEDVDLPIIERVQQVAEQLGVPMASVAIAWLLARTTAPVVGMTKPRNIEAAVLATELELTPQELAFLEEPYQAHKPVGLMAKVQQETLRNSL